MSNDLSDVEWRCACGTVKPDFDDACNECGILRYPNEVEEDDSLSNLYNDETNRMQQAMELKR